MAEIKSMEERDWKWLPDVALASTLSYVVNPQDYVRFSLVCKPWHSVAKDRCRNFTADGQEVPLLLLPPKEDSSCGQWSVYSVTEKRLLDFKLKVPYRKRYCFRSSYGWLVFAEQDESRIIKLFNPFTRTEISLPPLNGKLMVCINMVNLSADPSVHPSDYVVAAVMFLGTRVALALIRPGRLCDQWTYFIGECAGWVRGHIIFDNNRKWVYVVESDGMVVRANADAPAAEQATLETVVPPWNDNRKFGYFVETTLNKYVLLTDWGGNVMKVFKLDDSGNFVEVDGLNGDAVFTRYNCTVASAAGDFRGVKANCIYFMGYRSHRIWEYNVKDKTKSLFDDLPNGESQFSRRCYWITPTINL